MLEIYGWFLSVKTIIIWFCSNNDWENFRNLFLEKWKQKRTRRLFNNVKKLYSTTLSIYYNEYNGITDEEKEKMRITDLLQVKDILNSKKEDEEKSKSQPKEAIAERVK